MILRKPYAILIKNFRLIHIVMSFMIGYLAYRTNLIISFINDYMSSSTIKISTDVVNNLYGEILFILITLVIIFTIIIMAVLNFKKKPIKFYIYNIITHIYALVIYIISAAFVNELTHSLVEIRTLKLVSDFATAAFLFQVAALVYVVIRAVGFDIKSFNFKEDLAELEIEEKDNEEFEVNLEVDTDKLKRGARKKLRYAKYIYVENKFFINILIVVFIMVSLIFSLLNVSLYNRTYKDSQTFKTNQFMIQIRDSYITNSDYKGKKLEDGYNLVVVRFSIKRLYAKSISLSTARFNLLSKNNLFRHVTIYNDELKDFGNTYIKGKIPFDNYANYILVFKVPVNFTQDKMTLIYNDTSNDDIKIEVKPTNLNSKSNVDSKKLTEELKFNGSILENTILKINSYELNNTFKLDYKYCTSKNVCYDSVEYLNVSASDNYSKTLLKLEGSLTFDEILPINKYKSIYKFINEFGSIKYVVDGTTKVISSKIKEVKPKKTTVGDTYFLEVPNTLFNAEKIYLEFNVRNKVYTYALK